MLSGCWLVVSFDEGRSLSSRGVRVLIRKDPKPVDIGFSYSLLIEFAKSRKTIEKSGHSGRGFIRADYVAYVSITHERRKIVGTTHDEQCTMHDIIFPRVFPPNMEIETKSETDFCLLQRFLRRISHFEFSKIVDIAPYNIFYNIFYMCAHPEYTSM
jgi:hypothetical protein